MRDRRRNRWSLLVPVVAGAVLLGCQADQEAQEVDGEPVRLDRAEEIERAPAAPQEIITEDDTFPRTGDTIADTIRIEEEEQPDPDPTPPGG